MISSIVQAEEKFAPTARDESENAFARDPRWQLVQRIVATEAFRKSTRLPGLLLYLAQHTLKGERHKLTEQAIGQAVFGKRQHYNPAEDSAVRVYVRQLRLRLHEYYQSTHAEDLIVSIPKGGYALEFSPVAAHGADRIAPTAAPVAVSIVAPGSAHRDSAEQSLRILFLCLSVLFAAATVVCAVGWYRAASSHTAAVPWPLDGIFHKDEPTTLVVADAGFALRMLGDQEVPLDRYIDHSYLQSLLPKHMSENESIVLHYFDSTRVTSEADAHAAAVIAALGGPYAENLLVRSARDINANELAHGGFIFIGSKTSNPWVELLDSRMNFPVIEDGPHGNRYILNRSPLPGEQPPRSWSHGQARQA